MSPTPRVLLRCLGTLLATAYCGRPVPLAQLTKVFLRDCLILNIADHWHFNYALLPDKETFYHALRNGKCGNATMEKLALLYFAFVEKWSDAQVQAAILGMMKRKKLAVTPYWDRFVAEYEKLNNKTQHSTLPSPLGKWLAALTDRDYNKLAKEMMKGKRERVSRKVVRKVRSERAQLTPR